MASMAMDRCATAGARGRPGRWALLTALVLSMAMGACASRGVASTEPHRSQAATKTPVAAGPALAERVGRLETAQAADRPATPGGRGVDARPASASDESPDQAVAALLRPPAATQCLEQIESGIEADSDTRVLLGDGAFAHSDRLVLERARHQDAGGRLLDGRARPETPLVYLLRRRQGQCSLIRVEDRRDARANAIDLPACECMARPAAR